MKKKTFKIRFSFAITELQENNYTATTLVETTVDESIPVGTDPVSFLRSRLGEEYKRKTQDLKIELPEGTVAEQVI